MAVLIGCWLQVTGNGQLSFHSSDFSLRFTAQKQTHRENFENIERRLVSSTGQKFDGEATNVNLL